jgi:hypothetical protein
MSSHTAIFKKGGKYLPRHLQQLEREHAIVTLTVPGPNSSATQSRRQCAYHARREQNAEAQRHKEDVHPEDRVNRVERHGLAGRQILIMVLMGNNNRNKQRKKRKERQTSRHQRATRGHRRGEEETRERGGGDVDR